jgi:hypothetical protein
MCACVALESMSVVGAQCIDTKAHIGLPVVLLGVLFYRRGK